MRRVFRAMAVCAVLFGAAAAEPTAPEAQPAPFVHRFAESDLGPRWGVSEHTGTGEWSSVIWRRSQVSLSEEGAVFTLAANPEGVPPNPEGVPKPYISGEIHGDTLYRYGYFETRMRIARGAGTVSAFFTFARPAGRETWNEIDMEFTGRDPRRIELVYHVAGDAALQVLELPFDASAGFHTYAFEWLPNEIRWYIDNRLVHISRGGRVAELVQPQRIFFSLWNSERMPRWLGPINPDEAPWTMTVACAAYAPTYEGRSLCAR
ncbi:MAG: family 16 glycosylhydrolase [Hyphomonadaceae bacterium]|nr:family 16 glycosylhydrolase [Hyphomonadaceae bacterium]